LLEGELGMVDEGNEKRTTEEEEALDVTAYSVYECQLIRATNKEDIIFRYVVHADSSEGALNIFMAQLNHGSPAGNRVYGDFDVTIRQKYVISKLRRSL